MPTNIPIHLRNDRQFSAGRVTISAAAQEALRGANLPAETLIARHCAGDYGEVTGDDANANGMNIHRQGKVTSIFSVTGYPLGLGRQRIWVHTSISESWTYICVQEEVNDIY